MIVPDRFRIIDDEGIPTFIENVRPFAWVVVREGLILDENGEFVPDSPPNFSQSRVFGDQFATKEMAYDAFKERNMTKLKKRQKSFFTQ